MNRREFLAAPGLAAAALGASTRPIGAAFLGASHSHAKDKLKIIGSSPSFHLVSVWDEDETVRQKLVLRGSEGSGPGPNATRLGGRGRAGRVRCTGSSGHAKMHWKPESMCMWKSRRQRMWQASVNC